MDSKSDPTESPVQERFVRPATNGSTDHAGSGLDDDRSVGEVVKDMAAHAQELVRGEFDLVKAEVSDKAKAMGKYIAMGIAAGVLGLVSLVFLGHLIAQALNEAMPAWASYLIVTVLYLAVAGGLALAAKKGIQNTNPAPKDSVEHAKEDIQWVKTHK